MSAHTIALHRHVSKTAKLEGPEKEPFSRRLIIRDCLLAST
jgi:hypothetical protein